MLRNHGAHEEESQEREQEDIGSRRAAQGVECEADAKAKCESLANAALLVISAPQLTVETTFYTRNEGNLSSLFLSLCSSTLAMLCLLFCANLIAW